MSIDINIKAPSRSEVWVWQSAFLVCSIAAIVAIFLLPPEIGDFRDRTIGITVLKDINPYYRNYIYILALVACFSLASCIFLSFSSRTKNKARSGQDSLAWLLGACALLNLLAYFVLDASELYIRAGMFGFTLLVLWQITQKILEHKDRSKSVFFRCLCISWQGASLLFLIPAWQSGMLFWLVWIVSFCALLMVNKYPAKWLVRPDQLFYQYICQALLRCLVLAPILFIGANELSYFSFQYDIQVLTPLVVFTLLSLTIFVWSVTQKKLHAPSAFKLALCVIVSNIIFNEYASHIQYAYYDLFHFGERLLPLQQWAGHGLLPFVDYLPTHGLFDVFPHMIYQQISGSSPFEALIWGNGYFLGWLMRAIAIALLYSFVAKIIEPLSAFFLLWLLPSYQLVDPYYTLLLLPAIHILNIQRVHSQNRWWLIQWLLTVMIMLWRLASV